MFDLIRKSLLAGLGAAIITTDKVMEATRQFVKEGKMSTEEAEKLAQDLVDSGKQQWNEVQNRINETVRKGLDSLDFVNRKDYQNLNDRVAELEKRVANLEQTFRVEKEIECGP